MTGRVVLWERLRDAGLVAGDPSLVEPPSPWYVRALLGIAGWLAAIFLLGFVAAGMAFVLDNSLAAVIVGLVIVAVSAVLMKIGLNSFATQLGLAVSFAGQGLVIYGVANGTDSFAVTAFVIAVFEALLAGAVSHTVHRVCSAAVAGIAFDLGLADSGASYLGAGLLALLAAWLWASELNWARTGSLARSIAYGVTLALVIVHATWFGQEVLHDTLRDKQSIEWFPRWLGLALQACVLIGVVIHLLGRARKPLLNRRRLTAMVAVAGVAAASFEAPGIATALALVLIGYAHGNRVLVGIGVVALLGYLSAYYYLLETTLLVKAQALVVTGLILLLTRWAMTRWSSEVVDVEADTA